MSSRTRRYEEGLSGIKPGGIYLDKEGHRAQEAGYRQYLANKNLADQLSDASQDENGSDAEGWTPFELSLMSDQFKQAERIRAEEREREAKAAAAAVAASVAEAHRIARLRVEEAARAGSESGL
jgi:hypothetical protein